MKKEPSVTPELRCIGSVQELTAAISPPTNGSVICDDFSTEDALRENGIP